MVCVGNMLNDAVGEVAGVYGAHCYPVSWSTTGQLQTKIWHYKRRTTVRPAQLYFVIYG